MDQINWNVQSYNFQIGPTGGDNGYSAITGHVGWGIAWYINGLLIPEIYVVRGKTYTFVVEGGDDKEFPAGYHPFYITDDPEGGYEFKSERERRRSRVRTRQKAANIVKKKSILRFSDLRSSLEWSRPGSEAQCPRLLGDSASGKRTRSSQQTSSAHSVLIRGLSVSSVKKVGFTSDSSLHWLRSIEADCLDHNVDTGLYLEMHVQ